MKTHWKITKDYTVVGDGSVEGIEGPFGCTRSAPTPYRFKMYDDDGEIMLAGVCSHHDDENAFAPLEDFGMPSYGCTEIRYQRDGKTGPFETL
ncbi:MAG: hypothetical protein ABGX83_05440 [Nitrospira sp.]